MFHSSIRDLLYRRRRYLISTLGCGLVFAMSLVMTGLADAFAVEWRQTVEAISAAAFAVPEGVTGPFTGANPFEASALPPGTEAMTYGVQMAYPTDTQSSDDVRVVALFGVIPGGPLEPAIASGRQLGDGGEVLVSDRSPFEVGSTVRIGSGTMEVVGTVAGLTVNGGMVGAVTSLEDGQAIVFGGLPLVSTGVYPVGSEVPAGSPGGDLVVVSAGGAIDDALKLLESARQSIGFVRALLWAVAALIVGSVVYLSVIERLRDFAVFKAIGTSTRDIALGVVVQSSVLALGSALIGVVLGNLLAPVFPMPVEISVQAMVALPVLGLVVGILASLFGLQRVLNVEPAMAFGGVA